MEYNTAANITSPNPPHPTITMASKSKTGQATAPNDQRTAKQSGGAKNAYLLAYNAVSAALWAGVLYQTVTIGGSEIVNAQKAGAFFGRSDWFSATQRGLASGKVYDNLEYYTRMVQSLAGLEVLHSLVGVFTLPFLEKVTRRFACEYEKADTKFQASSEHLS